MLTGSPETAKQNQNSTPDPASKTHILPPIKSNFKLYERRNIAMNKNYKLQINPIFGLSLRNKNNQAEIVSPSMLDFPALVLSPVTPLIPDPFNNNSEAEAEEAKAIREKGFYLHPSPPSTSTTPRDNQPLLLPLFPVTSPPPQPGPASWILQWELTF